MAWTLRSLLVLLALGMLYMFGVLILRRVRGLPGHRELFPDVSANLVLVPFALCFPLALVGWPIIWLFEVRRIDGTAWTVPWKAAYTLAALLPITAAAFILSTLGVHSGTTGASLPVAVLTALVVGVVRLLDALSHRTHPQQGKGP